MRRHNSLPIAAILVGIGVLYVGGVWATTSTNRAVIQPATQTLRFQADGNIQRTRAEYQDATGRTTATTLDGAIRVTNLEWAVLAVTGVDVSCTVLLDGVTQDTEQPRSDGDTTIATCVYAKDSK